jgi:hypothetical protein
LSIDPLALTYEFMRDEQGYSLWDIFSEEHYPKGKK